MKETDTIWDNVTNLNELQGNYRDSHNLMKNYTQLAEIHITSRRNTSGPLKFP